MGDSKTEGKKAVEVWVTRRKRRERVDQIIFTDNSVCYSVVRKGRSSIPKINALYRFLFLVQFVCRVRIHPRWVSAKLMPADYLTRSETVFLESSQRNHAELEPGGLQVVAIRRTVANWHCI